MKIRCLLSLATWMIMFCHVAAQSLPPGSPKLSESLLESITSMDVEANDYEAILIDLEFLQKNPLDLNRANREDLERLPFLTDFQISSFLSYRENKGYLLSIYELQVIHGFTDMVIGMTLPFVTVSGQLPGETYTLKNLRRKGNHEVIIRTQRVIETSKGYSTFDYVSGDKKYPGNPWLINARYEFELNKNLRAGVTMEKDPGEELFRGSNRAGFDFNSLFIMVNNAGPVKSAIIGDYRLAFGQGLTLWNGAAPGKSSMPLSIVKRQDAVKPFTSNDENNFLRGMAGTVKYGPFNLSLFFSSKKRDANITDTISDRIYFSSLQGSGYHRTLAEIADEKAVSEMAFGGNLNFRSNVFKVGSTVVAWQFDKYLKAGDDIRDIHKFSGRRLLNMGFDYSVTLKKLSLFGETSYGNSDWATLNGAIIHAGKYASFSMLYRRFGPGYFSLHSSAFSESSVDSNEEGFYTGVVLHPMAKLQVSAYADFYHFPWLKHNTSAPSSGSDYLVQVDYTVSDRTAMHLRIKYASDPEDRMQDTLMIAEIAESEKTGIRYHIRYALNEQLIMQNRIELVSSHPASSAASRGFLFYHDAEFSFKKVPVVLDLRISFFSTGSYASRIYAYEQDMTSGYSFSPLYGKGCRSYIMIGYKIGKQASLGIRWSNIYYFNKDEIGSGWDVIHSATKNDIKFRLSYRF